MARLIYPLPDGSDGEFELTPQSGEIIIGRHPRCPIVVKSPSVSRQHAKIVYEDGRYVLHDMGSANGTFLGEDRITSRPLVGKRIEFKVGDVPIILEGAETSTARAAPRPVAQKAAPAETPASDPEAATRTHQPVQAAPRARPRAQVSAPAEAPEGAYGDVAELKSRLRHQTSETRRVETEKAEVEKQLATAEQQLKETREQVEDLQASVEEAEARVTKLENQIEDFIRKESERADLLSNLKIQVVHKERQLEEARRALDLKEYDLQQLREEMQGIEDRFNEDNRIQGDLEQRVNELREVIAEKENHIRDLRQAIDDKDYEVRQVKLGVGITDMEEERRKLLEDHYTAHREVQRLRELIDNNATGDEERQREVEGLRARVKQLEARVEEKKDVSLHPDFKAKEREIERQKQEIDDAHATIIDLTKRLKAINQEEYEELKKKVTELQRENRRLEREGEAAEGSREGELGAYRDRVAELEAEMAATQEAARKEREPLQARVAELEDQVKEAGVGPQGAALSADQLAAVREPLEGLKNDVKTFRSYLRDVEKGLKVYEGLDPDALGADRVKRIARLKPEDAMARIKDVLALIDDETEGLDAALTRLAPPE